MSVRQSNLAPSYGHAAAVIAARWAWSTTSGALVVLFCLAAVGCRSRADRATAAPTDPERAALASEASKAALVHDAACSPAQDAACESDKDSAEAARSRAIAATEADLRLFREACAGGERIACTRLAGSLEIGDELDVARARQLYEKSCELGHSEGCHALAGMLHAAKGGTRDDTRAVELLDSGCEAGYHRSCAQLGSLYLAGTQELAADRVAAARGPDDGDGARAEDRVQGMAGGRSRFFLGHGTEYSSFG